MAYTRIRNRVTIGGAVLLMSGAICFVWWNDEQPDPTKSPTTSSDEEVVAAIQQTSLNPLLRSISVLFCLIGGFLLFFGLLWSAKVNRQMSRGYRHWSRATVYFNTMEWRAKYRHSPDNFRVPSYNEALNCRPVVMVPSSNLLIPLPPRDPDLPPSYEMLTDIGRVRLAPCKRSLSDSALSQRVPTQILYQEEFGPGSLTSATYTTPPPSYENLRLHI
ncbi:transmembrane protein 61-like [Scyliorhinus canicula]|uniref:transmembrane protein 61-like n=1 Tax=Scyliorhinus canicula TaxID=7830 RepID=UPI0018F7239A|nr:transmembrane protein 61-like [Scyliorhinus canicula]